MTRDEVIDKLEDIWQEIDDITWSDYYFNKETKKVCHVSTLNDLNDICDRIGKVAEELKWEIKHEQGIC